MPQLERFVFGSNSPESNFDKDLQESLLEFSENLLILLNNGLTFEDNHADVTISDVSNNDILQYNSTTEVWENKSPPSSVGGSDTQVQFNDDDAFGGDAGLTYNKTTNVLTGGGFTDGTASLSGGSLTGTKLGSLTTNGFVVTSGGDGTLSVDTSTYLTSGDVSSTYLPLTGGTLTGKLKFTQTDGNEYIDSLADGFMDYGATTRHRFNAPITISDKTLLGTPVAGTFEFDNDRVYVTNVATQRAIDRTSDVAVATVTVANTTTETTLWTGAMPANSLMPGNVFKFHADGTVENTGATATDEVTIRIKVNGVTKSTINPNTKTLAAGTPWHIDANATQRTIGATGSRAIHIVMVVGDPNTTGDEVHVVGVAAIDTTASMDVTVTAQWASADAGNTISLYQGFMEYKN